MSMPIIIAINQTAGDILLTRLGLTVPSSGQITLTDYATVDEIINDESLYQFIIDDDILLSFGDKAFTKGDSLKLFNVVTQEVRLPVLVLSNADETLSGTTTIDGVALSAKDRVLLTAQSPASENGVWVVQAGAWTRPLDFNTDHGAAGAIIFVESGTVYENQIWVCTTNSGSDIIDTSNLAFEQSSSSSAATLQTAYDAGTGGDGVAGAIVTNSTDGKILISGSEKLQVTATSGLDVDTIVDFDVTTFDVLMSGTNGFSIDGTASSNVSVTSGNLTLSTITSGSLLLDAITGLEINASGGAISIGNDADAQAINIGTGAAARTITVGNSTGATALTLNAGTGAINIGTNAVAHTVTVGTTTGAAATVIQSGTGNITLTAPTTTISGDLVVNGTAFVTTQEIITVSDNHLYLNAGYTVNSAQTGGLVVNYLPTATATTVAASGFTAGVAAVSNPTIITVGSATFSASDIIQISGATVASNNGIFEVLSHVSTTLTIRGIGLTATTLDFTQNQLTTSAGAVGDITKVNISVIRSGTDGIWETALGSTTALTFSDIASVTSTTLQQAYTNGNTIAVTSAEGPLAITLTSDDFTVNGNNDVDFGSSTAVATFNVDSAGAVTLDSTGGAISIGANADAQAINIGTGAAARTVTVGNGTGATALTLNAGTGAINIGTNAVAHTVTVGTTTGVGSTVLQTGTGAMTFTAGGIFDVNSTGAVTLDSSGGAISIGANADAQAINIGTGAAARTITVGNGTGATAVDINAGTGAINIGTNAVAHTVTVGTTTGIGSTVLQTGTGAMTFTAGGVYDVNAVGAVTLDSTGAAISIGAGADAQAINIGTGAAARTITVGNGTGATALTLNAGTGAINIGTNAVAHTVTVGNGTGVTSVILDAGTGPINIGTNAVAHTVTVGNSTGATSVVLDSGTGPINIGTNAIAHTVTVGTTTGAGSTVIQTGTGPMTFTAGGIYDVNSTGAVTLDSTGGAISIGAGADAQAINIGTGAAARTITMGNGTGATSLVLDAGTGAINIGTNAIAHTVTIGNGTGATSVVLDAGTGAINIGTNAIAHTVTMGTTTGAGSTVLQTGTGPMTFTAGGIYDVNSTGAVTLDSTGGAISIGADADAQAINIGTGAAARTITMGNGTGATALTLNAGTGAINIGTNAVAHTVTVGTTTGIGSTVLQTGTGAMTFTAGGIFDVNSTGAVTLDSTGAAISIGAGADAQAINIGTGAAARTITVGNSTGATGLVVTTGTEKVQINSVTHYGKNNGNPTARAGGFQDGDQYYDTGLHMEMRYDSTRTTWYSITEAYYFFGRANNVPANVFYRDVSGAVMTATHGYIMPYNGSITGLGYIRADSDAATFEVLEGGVSRATLASSATAGKSITLTGNFSADGILSVKNQSGGNDTTDVIGWIRVNWKV